MISKAAIEESVLSLLCFSQEHAPLLYLKITDSKLFTTQTNQKIAEAAIEYLKKYSQPPRGALEYLLEADMQRGEAGKLLRSQIELLAEKVAEVDASFVIQELDKFIEKQKLIEAFQASLEDLQEDNIQRAKERVYQATSLKQSDSTGIWFHDKKGMLRWLERDEDGEYFSSGIPEFDIRRIRPKIKTFFLFLGSAKSGKSWFLVNQGKMCLQHHYDALHITLELSEDEIAKRYLQSVFSLTQYEAQTFSNIHFIKTEQGIQIDKKELTRNSVLAKRKDIEEKLEWFNRSRLLIKEFPTGTLSVEQLFLYLESLEKFEGFKPKVLILDYADLMKINAESLRIETGVLYKDLRGLAGIKKVMLVSASQGNREGDTAKVMGKTNVAEDWSKVGTVDLLMTYSQTEAEYKLGLARIYVAASRISQDKITALISQNYNIGQFALSDVIMSHTLNDQIKQMPS